MRTIEVSSEVFARIWSLWREGDSTEDDILRRVLGNRNAIETTYVKPTPQGKPDASQAQNLEVLPAMLQNDPDSTAKHLDLHAPLRAALAPARKVRWVDDIRQALAELGGEGSLGDIYKVVVRLREGGHRSLNPNWESTIRQTLQAHSSDMKNFGNREDYFKHVAEGRWRLREDR